MKLSIWTGSETPSEIFRINFRERLRPECNPQPYLKVDVIGEPPHTRSDNRAPGLPGHRNKTPPQTDELREREGGKCRGGNKEWGRFLFVDSQGKLIYSSSSKKQVLITFTESYYRKMISWRISSYVACAFRCCSLPDAGKNKRSNRRYLPRKWLFIRR